MSSLSSIACFAQDVAEIISSVLNVEVQITDENLITVAGTGEYKKTIGEEVEPYFEESPYMYANILRTGQSYIVENPVHCKPDYGPITLGEIGEICCPIIHENSQIGIIALVAFNYEQKHVLLSKKTDLLYFLQRMATLLASHIAEKDLSNSLTLATKKLQTLVESIPLGIIAVHDSYIVSACNATAELLLDEDLA